VEEFAVLQTLAHYVRAADYRDGAAMAALFLPEGRVVMGSNEAGRQVAFATLEGREAISHAVTHLMQPHPARGWSHHTTHDPIVVIDGDRATIDAQLIVFSSVGKPEPAGGWPAGTVGLQGNVTPIESGYYRPELRRIHGRWLIETMRILLDQTMPTPKQAS
jgi:SnoaL-like domain